MRLDYLRPPSAPTHGDDRLRLAGTKGVIEYQASTGLTLVTTGEPPKRIEALPERGWVFVDFLAAAFLGRKPAIPHEEIYRSTELALAAWRSAETGAPLAT
jgi:predicted dehydrogenase